VGRGSAGQPGAGREPSGAKGAAGTAVTAGSETLRSVAAVTSALTNTAGVTASIGFSKSKSTTATQEQAVVGSSVAGGTVNITATGSDIKLRGSSITSTGNTTLTAARDVILESTQETINSQFKSSSSGASLGVTVGVAVVGGVSASKSSGTSTETSQANSSVTAGGTLSLSTGRDAILKGAVAEGQNVTATIGRDLSVESVQDTATATSKSVGGSLSFSGKSP
jgi:filamentous hemagglutinin